MTFREKVASLVRRRRPLTREDAAEIADWVNEGGTYDPAGPPPVLGVDNEGDQPPDSD